MYILERVKRYMRRSYCCWILLVCFSKCHVRSALLPDMMEIVSLHRAWYYNRYMYLPVIRKQSRNDCQFNHSVICKYTMYSDFFFLCMYLVSILYLCIYIYIYMFMLFDAYPS